MMQKIAFIGLGIMGEPMAGHLLSAGLSVVVHSRTRSKAESLISRGATWANTAEDAARDVDVVLICVTDTPDVRNVLLGESGVLKSARSGLIVIDHSTISPVATRQLGLELKSKGVHLIDAPISGGDIGARNATLSIMCGGDREAFDTVLPLLEKLGKTITYCGDSGCGQVTKLVNQILVLGTLNAVCEAIHFAKAGGLDIATTLQAVGAGAGKSWQLEQLGPKIAAGDYKPGFMIDLAMKDLRLVQEFAEQSQTKLAGIDIVHQLYCQVQSMGYGRSGTQALYLANSEVKG